MFGNSAKDSYSAFVSWAKVSLYVGALALLSSLFLFSGSVTITDSIIYADLDVDELIQEQRMAAPYFTTKTENDVDVVISAAYAKPAQSGLLTQDMIATFTDAQRDIVTVRAAEATVDDGQGTATLAGNVRFSSNDTYLLNTEGADIDLDNAVFASTAPVDGIAPFGKFTAGRMTLQRTAEGSKLTFTGGIEMVYHPKLTD